MDNNMELYDKLASIIEKLRRIYNYYPLELFSRTVNMGIEEIISNGEIDNYEGYLISELNSQFKANDVEIIDEFISKNISVKDNYEDCLEEIRKLLNLFKSMDYEPSVELISDLIRSRKELGDNLKVIALEKNYCDHYLLRNFLELYSIENGIDLGIDNNNISDVCDDDDDDDKMMSDNEKIYFSEILRIPVLSKEEAIDLLKRVKEGDQEARNKMIESNLRLVAKMARYYTGRGLAYLDLVQEGCYGLMRAVDKFDVNMGCNFSTYAYYWIKQSIERGLAERGKMIYIPVHVYESQKRYFRFVENFVKANGVEPTEKEIADALDISIDKVRELAILSDPISLNTRIKSQYGSSDDDYELGDIIPSDETIDEGIEFLPFEIEKLLKSCKLSDKEIEIIHLRYGFGGRQYTLQEIGEKYGVCRERIRQIVARVLNKIRNSDYIKDFAAYMDNPDKMANIATKKMRKVHSIKDLYGYFDDYTSDEVLRAIKKLPDSDITVLKKAYGDDLENPVYNFNISVEDRSKVYEVLIKIKQSASMMQKVKRKSK